MLLRPRYLALDSSHLTQWAHDWSSRKELDRAEASKFTAWMERSGHVLLVTLHHVAELSNHEVPATVLTRLRLLGGRPLLAWIGDADCEGGPGAVTNIMAAEVLAAHSMPDADATQIRDAVAPHLIRAGSGRNLFGPDPDIWLEMQPVFAAQAEKGRQIVALAHSDVVDIADKPLAELLSGRLRQGPDLRRSLDLLRGSFAVDIQRRGDRRIADPVGMAAAFVREVEEVAGNLPTTAPELVWKGLAMMDVGPDDAVGDPTVGQMLDLGHFRSLLKIAAEITGLPYPDLKRTVRREQIPAWIIPDVLRRHAPELPERKGSELTDLHLACLAPYADVTFVDKRTLEAFRRARPKEPALTALARRVERAGSYRDIPRLLDGD